MKEAIDYIAEAWENVTQTTIQNCWKKTGILTSSDDDDVDIDMEDFESDEDEFDLDYLLEDDSLQDYFKTFEQEIPTEEFLTEDQIINLIQNEEEENESDEDTSDEEIPSVSAKNGVNALKIFINYFEQQDDAEFNVDDLYIFRKYLRVAKTKEFNSKTQSTLDRFFERED